MSPSPWFASWFASPLYLDLYRHRDDQEAEDAIRLFRDVTGLGSGTRILDLACGSGRHLLPLVRGGAWGVGADLSPTLLAEAKRRLDDEGRAVSLVRMDMRRMPFGACFDGVAQLFTAFGYFSTDAENERVLSEVGGILKPGGWYMLDFLNAELVRATLQARDEAVLGDRTVIQERAILNGRVEKRIIVRGPEGEQVFHESVRLFSRGELEGMLRRQGFALRGCRGDYSGVEWSEHAPRCILFAQRGSA